MYATKQRNRNEPATEYVWNLIEDKQSMVTVRYTRIATNYAHVVTWNCLKPLKLFTWNKCIDSISSVYQLKCTKMFRFNVDWFLVTKNLIDFCPSIREHSITKTINEKKKNECLTVGKCFLFLASQITIRSCRWHTAIRLSDANYTLFLSSSLFALDLSLSLHLSVRVSISLCHIFPPPITFHSFTNWYLFCRWSIFIFFLRFVKNDYVKRNITTAWLQAHQAKRKRKREERKKENEYL